jgi:hypothetical protein
VLGRQRVVAVTNAKKGTRVASSFHVAEVIAELNYRVKDADREYFVNVVGEQTAADKWEAWLEFVPLDDFGVLTTPTETHQLMHADVVHWAGALTETFVQGALGRAVTASEAFGTRTAATPLHATDVPTSTAIDPFAILALEDDALRLQLRSFTRAELLTIIDAHELNPARLSLARVSDSQLVTFIVAAVEAQIRQGSRSD